MKHHTKDKGDLAVGFVIADMLRVGIKAAVPLSEHLPFDCIAIGPDGRLSRLSVKYRAARQGCIAVKLTSTWCDRHGVHMRRYDGSRFDAVAVYCPDTDAAYYVRVAEFSSVREVFSLRLSACKNRQILNVRVASDFLGAARLFQ